MKMADLEQAHPAARRALFRAFHIGGCSSCAYRPDETLAEVCARQDPAIDPQQAQRVIESAQEQEAALQISAKELRQRLQSGERLRLVDIRSAEEFHAVHIPGSELLTQELTQELLQNRDTSSPTVVLIDHTGRHVMDAVSYFIGHGLRAARALRGGIDAWAAEVDPDMPRYVLESPAASSSSGG